MLHDGHDLKFFYKKTNNFIFPQKTELVFQNYLNGVVSELVDSGEDIVGKVKVSIHLQGILINIFCGKISFLLFPSPFPRRRRFPRGTRTP